jgi:hypothetical protein
MKVAVAYNRESNNVIDLFVVRRVVGGKEAARVALGVLVAPVLGGWWCQPGR